MKAGPIRVVVVEDSPTARAMLTEILNAAPDMEVVATAGDGAAGIRAVQETGPDVVTMDVYMPVMDGLEATRRIMRECPVPIVVVSSMADGEIPASFRALEAGAVAFVPRPRGLDGDGSRAEIGQMVQTVRLMSEVRVVRRRAVAPPRADSVASQPRLAPGREISVIAVGASTGGPTAIIELVRALPIGAPPILIVQHIAAGFVDGLATWLAGATGHTVRLAGDGEPTAAGIVYLAPDGRHMGLAADRTLRLADAPPEHGVRPSVSHLFRSVAAAHGGSAAAVLLSGMGKDGASELLELRRHGALTFAQDAESAVVYGMPGEAVRLGAAQHVLPPEAIGRALAPLLSTNGGR